MAQKVKFACNTCGYESQKWLGKCPECGNWNTFEEVAVETKKTSYLADDFTNSVHPQNLTDVESVKLSRLSTGNEEFDRVLGGSGGIMGIVPGSVTLLSGDPGVGKSTLLLQIALALCQNGKKILYVSGEESESQVKLRAERLFSGTKGHNNLFIFSTTNIDKAVEEAKGYDLVIADSIQTMVSANFPGFPGSIPQIRYATSRLVNLAKKKKVPVFLVGHVTKEGIVAGPMILSHMVDTVLFLEGEKITGVRILRSFKNRFGDTSEVGIFLMDENGLCPIQNASEFFSAKSDQKLPGACITVVMEGTRPLLVEVQALVVPSNLTFSRRVATGIAEKRLELLLAVLEKTCKIPIARMDVFVNVVGGLKITEPASDLAVCLAILSSFKNRPLRLIVAIAEVGLLGELKTVVNLDKRIKEAKKFGATKILSVQTNKYLSDVAKAI